MDDDDIVEDGVMLTDDETLLVQQSPTEQPTTVKVVTDLASNVNKPVNTAGLNGQICGFTNFTQLTYFFEYSSKCSPTPNIIRTPSNPLMVTGQCNQKVPTVNATNLEYGAYCYRYIPCVDASVPFFPSNNE